MGDGEGGVGLAEAEGAEVDGPTELAHLVCCRSCEVLSVIGGGRLHRKRHRAGRLRHTAVGTKVGTYVADGTMLSSIEGGHETDGASLAFLVGCIETKGLFVGDSVGGAVGLFVGAAVVVDSVGPAVVGDDVGADVGETVGIVVGHLVGTFVVSSTVSGHSTIITHSSRFL